MGLNDLRTLERIRNLFVYLSSHHDCIDIDYVKKEINPNIAVEAIENVLADRERLKQENEKNKKLANIIFEHFYSFMNRCPGSGMRILKDKGFNIDRCDKCEYDTANCKDCIKEYFERKVKNEVK